MPILYEKAIVEKMIRLYCRLNHNGVEMCAECAEFNKYALAKLIKCPFGEKKTTCKKCSVHCYTTDKKQKIKDVMRFSGPRMMLYHPTDFIKHLLK